MSPIGRLTSGAGGRSGISGRSQLMIICTFRVMMAFVTFVPQSDVATIA
jgi:hypothetical protein